MEEICLTKATVDRLIDTDSKLCLITEHSLHDSPRTHRLCMYIIRAVDQNDQYQV